MIYFSVIALVLILITITHLYNWACREVGFDSENTIMLLFLTVIYLFIISLLLKYIIIWGNLII